MNYKKIIFATVFALVVSVSVFSQTENTKNNKKLNSIGGIGSYNPFMPSIWSIGIMAELSGVRVGMSLGGTTITYEEENPYSSTRELTEYWVKSIYWDFIGGYVYQISLIDILGLRLGGDIIFSISPAYGGASTLGVFNWAFSGIAGIKLFPNGKYYISIDVCPGYNIYISTIDKGAFIMPIRLGVGLNY